FIEGCKNPKSVAILLRGSVDNLLDEAERSLIDGLSVVADVLVKNKIVAGGGAIDMELAKRLREFAKTVGGKEQLAIEIFADAVESIPLTLITNSGFDPIDNLVSLRAAHEKEGSAWLGLDLYSGKIIDMLKAGVIEPLWVKIQELRSAVEASSMILRIDDVVAAKLMSPEAHAGAPIPGLPPDRQPKPTIK
ncbi:MAG: TCP-1/cpn60 chaperonin family protein, partial [Candidatus Helarchaeales archaeon]